MNDCWLNVKAMLGNKKRNNFKYKILELLCILMRCQKACTGDFSENTAAYLPVHTVHNNIICSQKITSEVKCKLKTNKLFIHCLCCSTKVMADIIGWVRPGGKDCTSSRILAVTLLILQRNKINENIWWSSGVLLLPACLAESFF